MVVIPGIGGSELVDPTRPVGEQAVWHSGAASVVKAITDPQALDISRELVPTRLLQSFTVVPFFKSIDGYDRLWAMLTRLMGTCVQDEGGSTKPKLDARLVAFPYDFRFGVRHAAKRLEESIACRLKHLGSRTQVILVAHSMGGLVARRWVAEYEQWKRCRAIITLGTPYRGAPKALDVIANGLYWGTRRFQRPALSRIVQEWHSVDDLAPIDERITDDRGNRKTATALTGFPSFADAVEFRQRLETASATHRETKKLWEDCEPEARPILKVIRGIGHATKSQARWNGSQLVVSKETLPDEGHGDGTVPYWSSVPPEWGGRVATQAMQSAGDNHGQIGHTPQVVHALLTAMSGDPPPLRGDGDQLFVGFDVPDICEPGDVLTGAVMLGGRPLPQADASRVQAEAKFIRPDHTADAVDVELQADGKFGIQLPHDSVGYLDLRVQVDSSADVRHPGTTRVAIVGVEG